MVFILVGAGAAFSWVISFAQIPQAILGAFGAGRSRARTTVMIAISIAFFVGCMFVDPIVVILILTPIFAPMVDGAGLDPVLVGTIVTLQVAIGSATPPFGCDIFTAIAIFKRPYLDVIRGTPPFIAMLLLAAVLLIIFPQIALASGRPGDGADRAGRDRGGGAAADAPDAEALFISCTALPALAAVARIEAAIGKPVVTSNQACIWRLRHLAGLAGPVEGFGALLAQAPAAAA